MGEAITSIAEFEDLAQNPRNLRDHLINRLYIQGYGEVTHQGRIVIDIDDEYYLEEDLNRWEEEMADIYDVYDMVEYALKEDPRNDEAEIWREFLG